LFVLVTVQGAAALAGYNKIPIFFWTTVGIELKNRVKYSTVVNGAGTVNG
jgi:hypothetical protein